MSSKVECTCAAGYGMSVEEYGEFMEGTGYTAENSEGGFLSVGRQFCRLRAEELRDGQDQVVASPHCIRGCHKLVYSVASDEKEV